MIFFGSFYLVNLILAIVSRSYLEQQNTVEAENQECQRRKTEEARQELEVHAILDVDNQLDKIQSTFQIENSSFILSNATANNSTAIPVFNETQQNTLTIKVNRK